LFPQEVGRRVFKAKLTISSSSSSFLQQNSFFDFSIFVELVSLCNVEQLLCIEPIPLLMDDVRLGREVVEDEQTLGSDPIEEEHLFGSKVEEMAASSKLASSLARSSSSATTDPPRPESSDKRRRDFVVLSS
jgi:hypothetical protein